MAIEDAAALGVVLPAGTRPDQITQRLGLYEDFRHQRAARIQSYSHIAGGDFREKKKDFDSKHCLDRIPVPF